MKSSESNALYEMMKDLDVVNDGNFGSRELCLEARHSISREVAKKRRQKFEGSIFVPKIYSRHIRPFALATENESPPIYTHKNQYRSKYKTLKKVFTLPRREKELLQRRRLQHPESYPIAKNQPEVPKKKKVSAVANDFNGCTKLDEMELKNEKSLCNDNDVDFNGCTTLDKMELKNEKSLRNNNNIDAVQTLMQIKRDKEDNDIPLSGSFFSISTHSNPPLSSSIVEDSYEINRNVPMDLRLNIKTENLQKNFDSSSASSDQKNNIDNSIPASIESIYIVERPTFDSIKIEIAESAFNYHQPEELHSEVKTECSDLTIDHNGTSQSSCEIQSTSEEVVQDFQAPQATTNANPDPTFYSSSINQTNTGPALACRCHCCSNPKNFIDSSQERMPTNSDGISPQMPNRNKEPIYYNRFGGSPPVVRAENDRYFGNSGSGIAPQSTPFVVPSLPAHFSKPFPVQPKFIRTPFGFDAAKSRWEENNNRFHTYEPEWYRQRQEVQYPTPLQHLKYLSDRPIFANNSIPQFDPPNRPLPLLGRPSLTILGSMHPPHQPSNHAVAMLPPINPTINKWSSARDFSWLPPTLPPYFNNCNVCPPVLSRPLGSSHPWWHPSMNLGFNQYSPMTTTYNTTDPQITEIPKY